MRKLISKDVGIPEVSNSRKHGNLFCLEDCCVGGHPNQVRHMDGEEDIEVGRRIQRYRADLINGQSLSPQLCHVRFGHKDLHHQLKLLLPETMLASCIDVDLGVLLLGGDECHGDLVM